MFPFYLVQGIGERGVVGAPAGCGGDGLAQVLRRLWAVLLRHLAQDLLQQLFGVRQRRHDRNSASSLQRVTLQSMQQERFRL